jgi:Mce-associated membrane protein
MPDEGDESQDSAKAKSDALALAEQAEAEAAEAEALAAAARARARAIQLRREAERETQPEADEPVETIEAETTEADEAEADAAASAEPTEQVEDPEDAEETEPGARRRRPSLSTALTAAAMVAIVGLLAASGWMIYQHHNVVQDRQRAAAYVATARQGVVNLTSLDFNKAKEDVQRVLDIATGEFKDDFQKRAADFESVVKDSKAVTEGSVTVTAVESMNKDSAVILVLANENVTNIAGAKDAPRTFRFRVNVVHDGDDLKVSKVEFVL